MNKNDLFYFCQRIVHIDVGKRIGFIVGSSMKHVLKLQEEHKCCIQFDLEDKKMLIGSDASKRAIRAIKLHVEETLRVTTFNVKQYLLL